ncbi:YrhC family protein [Robertmurraya korlensis]|uniref:YrhC family protein n=1 Tax=Robertmurraya korlensis TaxID=519977 RepID=UPI001E4B1ADF|nr:YrhC family protein [Robertmurraya korlensis]
MKDNNTGKILLEKMNDFKRFAVVLLAVGSFLYLGVIIPSGEKMLTDLYIMMCSSMLFLAGSIYFFSLSNQIKSKLDDINE